MSGREVVYLNLNEDPYLPADGGRTNLPHRFILVGGGQPIGLLAVTTDRVIDLVYVVPVARRTGVATALLGAATARLGALVHDERLTEGGLGFMRARRVRYAGPGRRKVTADQTMVDSSGEGGLDWTWRIFRVYSKEGVS